MGRGPSTHPRRHIGKLARRRQAPLDRFSDYDILLVVSDARPFAESNDWQRFFGEPLVRFGDSVEVLGIETHVRWWSSATTPG